MNICLPLYGVRRGRQSTDWYWIFQSGLKIPSDRLTSSQVVVVNRTSVPMSQEKVCSQICMRSKRMERAWWWVKGVAQTRRLRVPLNPGVRQSEHSSNSRRYRMVHQEEKWNWRGWCRSRVKMRIFSVWKLWMGTILKQIGQNICGSQEPWDLFKNLQRWKHDHSVSYHKPEDDPAD